jgi:hypothetical protein
MDPDPFQSFRHTVQLNYLAAFEKSNVLAALKTRLTSRLRQIRQIFKSTNTSNTSFPYIFPTRPPRNFTQPFRPFPDTQYGYTSIQVKGGRDPFQIPSTGYPSTQVKGGDIPSGYPVRQPIHTSYGGYPSTDTNSHKLREARYPFRIPHTATHPHK